MKLCPKEYIEIWRSNKRNENVQVQCNIKMVLEKWINIEYDTVRKSLRWTFVSISDRLTLCPAPVQPIKLKLSKIQDTPQSVYG